MFGGVFSVRRFSGVMRLWVQAWGCLLTAILFYLVGASPAHAVSQGCAAVRNGALNVTVAPAAQLNNPNFFTGAFETGEMIQWTIIGEPAPLNVLANANNVTVTGTPPNLSAKLTITANGTFNLGYILTSNPGIQTVITAVCLETTGERRAAGEVLLNTQLETDLHQQRQMQNDLAAMLEQTRLLTERTRLERVLRIQEAVLETVGAQIVAEEKNLLSARNKLRILEATRLSLYRAVNAFSFLTPQPVREKILAQLNVINARFALFTSAYQQKQARLDDLDAQLANALNVINNTQLRIQEIDALLASDSGNTGGVNFQLSTAPQLNAVPSLFGSLLDPAKPGPHSAGQTRMSFMADLNSLSAGAHKRTALNKASTRDHRSSPFAYHNVWVRGSAVGFDADQNGANRDGEAYDLATGTYFFPNDRMVIGAYYRYRDAESKSPAQSSDLETQGHGLGAHATVALGTRLSGEVHALYEFSDNDISTQGGNGSFDAQQLTLHGKIQGVWSRGLWSFEPGVQATYAVIDHDSYSNSAGAFTPSDTIERGQLLFGPRISHRRFVDGLHVRSISRSFSLNGIWNFVDADDVTLTNGTTIKGDDLALYTSGGLNIEFQNGASFSVSGAFTGLGDSKLDTYSISGALTIPLGR